MQQHEAGTRAQELRINAAAVSEAVQGYLKRIRETKEEVISAAERIDQVVNAGQCDTENLTRTGKWLKSARTSLGALERNRILAVEAGALLKEAYEGNWEAGQKLKRDLEKVSELEKQARQGTADAEQAYEKMKTAAGRRKEIDAERERIVKLAEENAVSKGLLGSKGKGAKGS